MLGCAEKVAVRVIPPGDIDRNGLHKSNLAGLRAMLHALAPPAEACLVDGFRLGPSAPEHTAVVDGDTKSAAIAAASIVAKVTRDRLMRRLDALYPGVRVRAARRLHHARAFRGRARARPVRSAPSVVPGALLSVREASAARRRWYRVRGWRVLGANVWAGGNELDLIVRRGRQLRLRRGEGEARAGLRRPARGGRPRRSSVACARAAETWLASHPELDGLAIGFDVVAVREGRLERLADAF